MCITLINFKNSYMPWKASCVLFSIWKRLIIFSRVVMKCLNLHIFKIEMTTIKQSIAWINILWLFYYIENRYKQICNLLRITGFFWQFFLMNHDYKLSLDLSKMSFNRKNIINKHAIITRFSYKRFALIHALTTCKASTGSHSAV